MIPHLRALFRQINKRFTGSNKHRRLSIFISRVIFRALASFVPMLNTSLSVRNFGGEFIVLLIYVDDIVVTSNNFTALPKLLFGLSICDERYGPLHYFLGIEARRITLELNLTQIKYIWDLPQQANMQDAKPIKSLVDSGYKLSKFSRDLLPTIYEYRSMVGALQYVTLTRPIIAFAVNQACQCIYIYA